MLEANLDDLNPQVFGYVMDQLLEEVVRSGTGASIWGRGINFPVAGKTGTAQVQGKDPHAWFIAFAPADHPRVAVVVLKENAGEGAYVAAPIARRILEGALPLVP